MKIKITENQLKRINELEVVQYEDNSSNIKNFYSSFDQSDTIDLEYSLIYPDSEVSYNKESSLNIDWSVAFKFDSTGFMFLPKINKANGFITIDYGDKQSAKIDISNFKIDTTQLKYHLEDLADFSFHLSQIMIDIDKKLIIF